MTDDVTPLQPKQLSEEYIALVDEQYLSPEQRAEAIALWMVEALGLEGEHELFVGELFWDLFCFSSGVILRSALTIGDPDLSEIARLLNKWTYVNHYNGANEFLSDGDRERRRSFWRSETFTQHKQRREQDGPISRTDDSPEGTEGTP